VDRTTLDTMLQTLEQRTGRVGGATVVVDRGMAFDDNLAQIQTRGHHYLVASRPGERLEHLEAFEDETGWTEVHRTPSPRNPGQRKTHVVIKRRVVGAEIHILCRSDGRTEKDRAIREKHEARFLTDLRKLHARVAKGRLRAVSTIHEALGRLKERYPRVARYYALAYDPVTRAVTWIEEADKKAKAVQLDGAYLLKTDRQDLPDPEIWHLYMMLTRVEAAFRALKSPLLERPIFHHKEDRVQTHIFLCVLAYHLLVAIEKRCLDQGVHTSWATLRDQLSTHQVVTVVLPTSTGEVLKIRRGTTAEPSHREIYRLLRIPEEVIRPVKTWEPPIVTKAEGNQLKT
jgi:transposase